MYGQVFPGEIIWLTIKGLWGSQKKGRIAERAGEAGGGGGGGDSGNVSLRGYGADWKVIIRFWWVFLFLFFLFFFFWRPNLTNLTFWRDGSNTKPMLGYLLRGNLITSPAAATVGWSSLLETHVWLYELLHCYVKVTCHHNSRCLTPDPNVLLEKLKLYIKLQNGFALVWA